MATSTPRECRRRLFSTGTAFRRRIPCPKENSMAKLPRSTVSRRDLLKLGGAAAATGAPGPAVAQTPKRGGTFRIATLLDPVGWDPHQTISFATMTLLSFAHSRLMKVK